MIRLKIKEVNSPSKGRWAKRKCYEVKSGSVAAILSDQEHFVFMLLYNAPEEIITKWDIYSELYAGIPHETPPDPKIIDVIFCNIRRKLKAVFEEADIRIKNIWGRGYLLTED